MCSTLAAYRDADAAADVRSVVIISSDTVAVSSGSYSAICCSRRISVMRSCWLMYKIRWVLLLNLLFLYKCSLFDCNVNVKMAFCRRRRQRCWRCCCFSNIQFRNWARQNKCERELCTAVLEWERERESAGKHLLLLYISCDFFDLFSMN